MTQVHLGKMVVKMERENYIVINYKHMAIETAFGFNLIILQITPGSVGSGPKVLKEEPLWTAGVRIFTGRTPFLSPDQQCLSTEGMTKEHGELVHNNTSTILVDTAVGLAQ